jgi:hypothetical protein
MVIGNVMYQRDECIAQASFCREKAQADPAHSEYWIDRAIEWHRRAILASQERVRSRGSRHMIARCQLIRTL